MPPEEQTAPQFVSSREPGESGRNVDRVATIALLVVSGLVAAGMAFAGLFLVFITDSCGSSSTCDTDSFATWWIVAMAAPLVGFAVTLIVSIVRLARKRKAFWIPLAGTAIFGAAFAGAVTQAFSSVS